MDKVDVKAGQKILLGVEDCIRVGDVTFVKKRCFIRLNNIRDVNTNSERGEEFYYAPEIQSIRIVDSVMDRTLTKIKNHVFINQIDVLYHEAIKYIRLQAEFGVNMESIEHGRHTEFPSLLSIATLRCIFIFDILWIRIPKDLAELLSSDRYRRVIHDGRMIKDVLLHRYHITLGKCFDTLVAHIATRKAAEKEVDYRLPSIDISIQDCVMKYFKIPDKFFRENVDFYKRMLSIENQLEAAKNVAFLVDLQNHFLAEIMLVDVIKRCSV
ncbi:piRNA biogenesis protein EXD1 [Anopheles ziemanni]|uniref:piRNA biogenesis protein EXD1-like n=1 Tax=Anopheles coustani TaxID=139045 RepID=UPI002658AB97|nr:piRNA biogenesis protein EXD1-like [Anopheles coustani]XP_058176444.1 piRNA biogenesis protein EXD1 [Anopheles ziemanni]